MADANMSHTVLLRDQAHQQLKKDIIRGKFRPGTLLNEIELATRLHIGKTPVREALGRLVTEGYVEAMPRVGYSVTEPSIDSAIELFDYRDMLESQIVERASRFATRPELTLIEQAASSPMILHGHATYWEVLQQNRQFHMLVAQAARNQYMLAAIERSYDQVDRLLCRRFPMEADSNSMTDDHMLLAQALSSRDGRAAVRAARAAMGRTRERVLQTFSGTERALNA